MYNRYGNTLGIAVLSQNLSEPQTKYNWQSVNISTEDYIWSHWADTEPTISVDEPSKRCTNIGTDTFWYAVTCDDFTAYACQIPILGKKKLIHNQIFHSKGYILALTQKGTC